MGHCVIGQALLKVMLIQLSQVLTPNGIMMALLRLFKNKNHGVPNSLTLSIPSSGLKFSLTSIPIKTRLLLKTSILNSVLSTAGRTSERDMSSNRHYLVLKNNLRTRGFNFQHCI